MVAIAPHVAQVVAAEVQVLAREQLLGTLLRQRRPLQLEEQQRRLDRGRALLRLLQQCAVGGIGGVGGEAQGGICAGAADQLVDHGELLHRLLQAHSVERAELAGVARGERLRPLQGIAQPPLHPVRTLTVHERLEVPGGRLELGVGRLGGGYGGHRPGA